MPRVCLSPNVWSGVLHRTGLTAITQKTRSWGAWDSGLLGLAPTSLVLRRVWGMGYRDDHTE